MQPKLLLVTLFATMMGRTVALRCVNQAAPRQGVGNYCGCDDHTCHKHSFDINTGTETCNPPGIQIPCPYD